MSRNKPNWKQLVRKAGLEGRELDGVDHRVSLVKAYAELTGMGLMQSKERVYRLWELNVTACGAPRKLKAKRTGVR